MEPKELIRRRKRLGISQAHLARLLEGMQRTRIWEYETGKIPIPRLLPLALEAVENRLVNAGFTLNENRAAYRVIRVGANYYRYPTERATPIGATDVEGVTDDNGLLVPEVTHLPLVFAINHYANEREQ